MGHFHVNTSGCSVCEFSGFGSVRFFKLRFRFGSVFQFLKNFGFGSVRFSVFRFGFGSVFGFLKNFNFSNIILAPYEKKMQRSKLKMKEIGIICSFLQKFLSFLSKIPNFWISFYISVNRGF